MGSLFSSLYRLLQDPPPEIVFEISPESVRMARAAEPQTIVTEPLAAGVLSPSPLHDNVVAPEALRDAVARLASSSGRNRKGRAAVLLPDHCAHISVLDFDQFPSKPEEQSSLVRFRVRKSVPFDVESAAISYVVQRSNARTEVVAAITARDIVNRYEAPFRAVNISPGFVSLAPLACLDLIDSPGTVVTARLSGAALTLMVLQGKLLKLARSIELATLSTAEIAGHLHQTLVYVEDNLGAGAEEIALAGFGALEADALHEFPSEFRLPVRTLGGADTGIRGYLKGAAA